MSDASADQAAEALLAAVLDNLCVNCDRRDDHYFCWRWLEWVRIRTGGWEL